METFFQRARLRLSTPARNLKPPTPHKGAETPNFGHFSPATWLLRLYSVYRSSSRDTTTVVVPQPRRGDDVALLLVAVIIRKNLFSSSEGGASVSN